MAILDILDSIVSTSILFKATENIFIIGHFPDADLLGGKDRGKRGSKM